MQTALDAYERLHQRLVEAHTPDVIDLSLTLAQLKLIYAVAASGPIRMGALAEQMGTSLSTTSGSADRLVRMGMLARREVPDDRRQVLVEATPKALEQIDRMSELSRTRLRELLESMSDTDIAAVEHAMRALADAAATMTEENR